MADGMMGLGLEYDNMNTLFGPSVLSGGGFGDVNSNFIFNQNPGDPENTATFPWLSNAPSGSVFSSGESTPTMDFLNNFGDSNAPGAFDLNSLLKSLGGFGSDIGTGISRSISELLPNDPKSLLPGTMALTYAAAQPNLDMGNLNAALGSVTGNRNAVVQAATDPFQQNIAAGYGDLLQSQGLRGIRGSSFGNTDIANYLATTGRALGNAGANAAQGSLSLQGNLAAQIAALTNQSQQLKNNLYGTAFDVLGRGLNPKGYTGSTNINVGGGGGAVPQPSGENGIFGTGISGQDVGAVATIASLFSDRRLKTNVVKIADDPRGFGIYKYEMFGKPDWGVMADEVEKVIPEAVTRCAGYQMVDYGRLYGR